MGGAGGMGMDHFQLPWNWLLGTTAVERGVLSNPLPKETIKGGARYRACGLTGEGGIVPALESRPLAPAVPCPCKNTEWS